MLSHHVLRFATVMDLNQQEGQRCVRKVHVRCLGDGTTATTVSRSVPVTRNCVEAGAWLHADCALRGVRAGIRSYA